MRLIDRYLLREFLIPFGYCLSGFFIFWLASDLIANLADYQRRHFSVADIVELYLVMMPEWLSIVLPVGLLLALLYSLTTHARYHELTAIRCAGVGLARLSLPYLLVGVSCSIFLLLINEVWAPHSYDQVAEVFERNPVNAGGAADERWANEVTFVSTEGRVWKIRYFNLQTFTMLYPHVAWRLADGSTRILSAVRAERTNDHWIFFEVEEDSIPSEAGGLGRRRSTNEWEFPELRETPEQIAAEVKVGRMLSNPRQASKRAQLSLVEIIKYQRWHPNDTSKRALLNTQLHARLAGPWTCLVVVFIAMPFGVRSDRRNAFAGVAASIFICFGYFVLMRLGLALGTSQYLPGWLSAWAPNLLFGGAGIWMTHRLR